MPKFSDIKQRTRAANYHVNVDWEFLISHLERYNEKKLCPLDLSPEFQRCHVWTEQQQIAYVEFKLQGGSGSDQIYFNCHR